MSKERIPGAKRIRTWLLAIGLALSSAVASVVISACDSGASSAGTVPLTGTGTVASVPSVASGERVFAQYCNACHPGGDQGAGPALKPRLPTLSDDQIRTIVRHGKRPMPAYNESLISNDQLASLVLFVRTLK